jgi:hypothetical protein
MLRQKNTVVVGIAFWAFCTGLLCGSSTETPAHRWDRRLPVKKKKRSRKPTALPAKKKTKPQTGRLPPQKQKGEKETADLGR